MKRCIRLLIVVALVATFCPVALSDCVVKAVGAVIPTPLDTTPTSRITLDMTGYPAPMTAGGTSELGSAIVIYDDGNGLCWQKNQVLTARYSAPISGPGGLFPAYGDLAIYDSSGSMTVSPSITFTPTGVATVTVFNPGPAGNLTTPGSGAAIVIQNLRFDLTNYAGSTVTANVQASIPGSYTASSLTIGQIQQAGPLTLSTSTVTFGDEIVGTTSSPTPIVLTNNGGLTVTFPTAMLTTGDFNQTNNCGTSLPAHGSCTVGVTFSPLILGARTGTLTIVDNTADSPHVVNLSGNGISSPGVPTITSLSPNHVIAGGPTFFVVVQGTNFAAGSTVLWNGSARPTTFLSSTSLSALIGPGDITTVGTASISVSNGSSVSNLLNLTIAANPITGTPYSYSLPYVAQGQGVVTKATLSNLSGLSNPVTITYLNPDGSSASVANYVILPLGTLRVATPESARFGPAVSQWAVVGSQQPLNVNQFLELTDTFGNVLNSIGFNAAAPFSDFSVPVEFTRTSNGAFTRTVGLALANPNDTPATAKLTLLTPSGTLFNLPYSVTIAPFGQTAFDLAQVPALASSLPVDDFVGTLVVSSNVPVASIALGDDLGPFAATPAVSGRSTLGVDQITASCPTAADVAAMNREFLITFESDPTVGTLACRAIEGSADLTPMQFRGYQALQVLRKVSFDAAFPWTGGKNLYPWMQTALQGIRFRGDITTSSCCNPPGTANIASGASSILLQTTGWLGSYLTNANAGLDTAVTSLVQQARSAQGITPSCSPNDSTISEMGVWAVALDIQDYISGHAGRFFADTLTGEPGTRYHDVANANSTAILNSKFCTSSNVQVQPISIDFGTQPISDMPVIRSVVAGTGNGTPFFVALGGTSSTIDGTNATDFSIVNNTCDGNLVPPGCTISVGFTPTATGQRSATLTIATPNPVTVPLTGFATAAAPTVPMPFTYYVPYIVSGNGYVTKITASNLTSLNTRVFVRYLNQAGQIAKTDTYTIAGGATLRIATPESGRFTNPQTIQWAMVGSTQPLLVNLFFEVENSSGAVINTVGFNAAPPLSSFLFPAEFQPRPDGTPGARTAGLAFANTTASTINYSVQLNDVNGNLVGSFVGSLGPYAQTAVDLSTAAAFGPFLPKSNLVGTVRVTANGPLSAIALEGDLGPFSATPVVPLQ